MAILQWNIRGIRSNKAELQLLLRTHSPLLLCLQETKLNPQDPFHLPDFTSVRFDLPPVAGIPAHGGVMLLIRDNIHSRAIPLNTQLQAVAVRLTLPGFSFSLCNIYAPSSSTVTRADLTHLIGQLPPPLLLVGDLNAHHPLWGSPRPCQRGSLLVDIFNHLNLICLNTGEPTFLSDSTHTYSHLDISVCTPQLARRLEWSVLADTHSSDHFPCVIRLLTPITSTRPRNWQLSQADWRAYSSLATFRDCHFPSIDAQVDYLTNTIISAADCSIPRTSSSPRRTPVPWWNEACRDAIRARRRALRIFKHHPTLENCIQYKRLRGHCRRVIRDSKKASWLAFTSSFNSSTPSSVVWGNLRRLTGTPTHSPIPGLSFANSTIVDPTDISNALGHYFAEVSSSSNYHPAFLPRKQAAEARTLSFSSKNHECYNADFTMWELQHALSSSRSSSPGPDGIHIQMLQHLSPEGLHFLLKTYNRIWTEGTFPGRWREAIVIPIPKPGKDKHLPSSYRPISLTSIICKVMERMINSRLVWWLESRNLLTNAQCGFRKHRSAVDHLVTLSTQIMNNFLRKRQTVAVFFDLEKAYDTCWRTGILRTLHNWGVRGRMPIFIQEFLKDRTFKVRVGTALSNTFIQENGVPQGAVLSVVLFAIAINPIMACLPPGISASLFVDDFAIYCSSQRTCLLERHLQRCLDRLYDWSTNNGFRFSADKTVCMNFWRRTEFLPPSLRLGPDVLPFVDTTKFLGLTFDRKLSWSPHVSYLAARSTRSLNLLKVLSGTSWGADRTTLLRLYRSLVRSKLDYGCIVYSSARPSILRRLNTIHHQGIRLATGAFYTSPVQSLYAEAAEMPLSYRREVLLSRYASRLSSMRGHPTYAAFFDDSLDRLYAVRPSSLPPPGVRFRWLLRRLDFTLPVTFPTRVSPSPPWLRPRVCVNFELHSLPKDTTPGPVYRSEFLAIRKQHDNRIFIYTDGSKTDRGVGCAFVIGADSFQYRLPNQCSIFTAELFALYQATQHIRRHSLRNSVICSDSLSALQSLRALYPVHPMVQRIQDCLHKLTDSGTAVVFLWVPGHVGVLGNEVADAAAKNAASLPRLANFSVPSDDLRVTVTRRVASLWHAHWSSLQGNKLRGIKPLPIVWSTSSRPSRREEVILARLRIGHCRFSHRHLLSGDPAPLCDHCSQPLTVRHLLVQCPFFNCLRQNLCIPSDLPSILADDPRSADRVLSFIRNANMVKEI